MKVNKNEVYVTFGRYSDNSTCEFCEKPDKYMVLSGGSQLSNLDGTCCKEHLPKLIDRGINYLKKYGQKNIKVIYNEILKREKKLRRITNEL